MKMLVTWVGESRPRIGGMVLAKNLTWGFEVEEFQLWRYSSGWSPVTCRFRPIESLGSGRDSHGRGVTFVNDEVVRSDPRLIGSAIDFDVDESINQSPPFLLLPDIGHRPPLCKRMKVRLHFSWLSELPDVQARNVLTDALVALLIEDTSLRLAPSLGPDPRFAVPPTSGLWLPVELGSMQGAVRLGDRQGDAFDAVAYLESDEVIEPGSLLRRSVTWTTESGATGSAEADIATVIETG